MVGFNTGSRALFFGVFFVEEKMKRTCFSKMFRLDILSIEFQCIVFSRENQRGGPAGHSGLVYDH
jgi:hypothetical protein